MKHIKQDNLNILSSLTNIKKNIRINTSLVLTNQNKTYEISNYKQSIGTLKHYPPAIKE